MKKLKTFDGLCRSIRRKEVAYKYVHNKLPRVIAMGRAEVKLLEGVSDTLFTMRIVKVNMDSYLEVRDE